MFIIKFLCIFYFFNKITTASKAPNIVVIIADDVGWNDVSFHGSDQISTPNIDSLGYHGIFLNRHYTYQVCTPSRAAFLTGKYPLRFGYQGYPLALGLNKFIPQDLITLPKALKRLGYRNHLIGKWHLGHAKKDYTPMGYGYDTHFGYWNGYMGYFDHSLGSFDKYNGTDLHDQFVPVQDKIGQYATDLFTERAIDIISNHPIEEPLHLVISHLAGHTGKTIRGIETVLEVHNMTETNEKYHFINSPERRMYAEIIERMDDSVGKVISALSDRNMLNNSIIVFFSDNGAATYGLHKNSGSNFPFRGIKMTMYEGAIRTPAAIFSPIIQDKGRIVNSLFHITDWVPTLFTAAGGNLKDLGVIDGINQWHNLINNGKEHPREEMLVDIDPKFNYSAYIGHKGRYKLIKNSNFGFNFSGESGFSSIDNHVKKVKDSLVNLEIEKLSLNTEISKEKISKLREGMYICLGASNEQEELLRKEIKPCLGICLYDLFEDPCEYNDIAENNEEIVNDYRQKIEFWTNLAAAKPTLTFDSNADPTFCNKTWFNWLDHDGCWFNNTNYSMD